jgi:hypothetical protein
MLYVIERIPLPLALSDRMHPRLHRQGAGMPAPPADQPDARVPSLTLASRYDVRRDKEAALTFTKKALERHGAAIEELGNVDRVENSHLPLPAT